MSKILYVVVTTVEVEDELFSDVVQITEDKKRAGRLVKALVKRDKKALRNLGVNYCCLAEYENAAFFTREIDGAFGGVSVKSTGLKDSKGKVIHEGDQVLVPSPSRKDDYWKHEFQGQVHCRKNKSSLICVIDQDDNGWDVEHERLTIVED
ncbi:MAG: hypothetical protein LUQ37_08640 [Methanoregulaceae archaeon]|nr:hypothetical protein [Methanoregulaceae archaeon]